MSSPTIIVENGSIVANANSYISQDDAVQYFTDRGDTVFTNASSSAQITALIRACDGMDWWLEGRWYGRRTTGNQSLDWPRKGVRDQDGYRVADNVVPQLVGWAQAEIAKIELTTPFIQQSVTRDNNQQQVRVGPITTGYMKTAPSITYWPQVIAMLKNFAVIGVMPIEVVIGLSEQEKREMFWRGQFSGSMNPFDWPDWFHLVKQRIYNSYGQDYDAGYLW